MATKDQVLLSLRWKLAALGAGRVNPQQGWQGPRPMCWAGGYKALNGKRLILSFLKRLDRAREQQIRRMHQAGIIYGPGVSSEHKGKRGRLEPVGYPFSHLAQCKNTGGQFLIDQQSSIRPFASQAFTQIAKGEIELRLGLRYRHDLDGEQGTSRGWRGVGLIKWARLEKAENGSAESAFSIRASVIARNGSTRAFSWPAHLAVPAQHQNAPEIV